MTPANARTGSQTLHIPADHPAFAGHFPGRPITPGVVLLDLALHALATNLARPLAGSELGQAKFLSPVGPDTVLTLNYDDTGVSTRFTLQAGERKVASGVITWPAP